MLCTLDAQLKSMTTLVEQQDQELREETQHLCENFNKEILNHALRLEAAKAAAWPPARLREVTRVPTGAPPERRRNERLYAGGLENSATSEDTAGRDRMNRGTRTRTPGGGRLRHQTHSLVSHLR
jgi:hypothetical protein